MSAAGAQLDYAALATCVPRGVYILPKSEQSWEGVVFVHKGYYAGGIFRFLISLPDYPSSCPVVMFTTPIYHPLVTEDGRLSIHTASFPWQSGINCLDRLLHYIKACFKREILDMLREDTCVNKEACRLYQTQTALFTQLAAQAAELSQSDSALFADKSARVANIINFANLTAEDEKRIRADLFGTLF